MNLNAPNAAGAKPSPQLVMFYYQGRVLLATALNVAIVN